MMVLSSGDLPEYKSPPLIEVVCGVQFEPLTAFSTVHFGEFWQRIKQDYPRTEDREPLPEMFEGRSGLEPAEPAAYQMPPLRRMFYIEASDVFLLQVQPSRFLANWRKEKETDRYPRFSTAYDRFVKGWKLFLAFLKDTGLGLPQTNQYELTYINHVVEGGTLFPAGIQDYMPLFSWGSAQSGEFFPPPRAANFRFQFPLPNAKGTLHVTVNHGQRKSDRKGVLVIDLTARGQARKDWSDMDDWFSIAHEWIVRGFTDLTSTAAHRLWGRER